MCSRSIVFRVRRSALLMSENPWVIPGFFVLEDVCRMMLWKSERVPIWLLNVFVRPMGVGVIFG